MKTLSIYKLGFLGVAVVLLGGLTGCVQQAVVSTHHSVGFDDRILITSNQAYYDRYGYPAGYVRSYTPPPVRAYSPPPRAIVVKKVKVIHAKPVYAKPHHPAPTRHIKKDSHKQNIKSHRESVKHHNKPRSKPQKPPQKIGRRQEAH